MCMLELSKCERKMSQIKEMAQERSKNRTMINKRDRQRQQVPSSDGRSHQKVAKKHLKPATVRLNCTTYFAQYF